MQHKNIYTTIVKMLCTTSLRNIFLMLLLFFSFATHAQTRTISLTAKNTPIKEVLAEIQQKSNYRILYNDEVVPDDLRVSVNTENVPVKNMLQTILANTGLTFVMQSEELIIVTKKRHLSYSNEIFGTVTDETGAPVAYANIILRQPNDPTKVEYGAVTDEAGYYKLANVKPNNYSLQVSFIGYKTQYADFVVSDEHQQPIVRNFTLPTDETVLQELVVEGQRPAMKAEAGKLIYHIPTLLRNKSATNAYDALKEIPGVMEQSERLILIGTNGMTVLLNGQKISMTYNQLMTLLKSTPLSRVEDVEIMYCAPPQYNIRGAAINVVLKQQTNEENMWQGEAAAEFKQRTYAREELRANVLYLGKHTTIDALYAYNNGKSYSEEKLTAAHTLNGTVHDISQSGKGIAKGYAHNARLALQHTFANKDKADVSYTGIYDDTNSSRTAFTNISKTQTYTQTGTSGPSSTHNLKADYSAHFGLNIGADYTMYKDQSDYFLENTSMESSSLAEKLTYQSKQDIRRMLFYVNQSHSLKNGWGINYGLNYSDTWTKNSSNTEKNGSIFEDATFDTRQREHIWNFFAGFSKSFSEKLSVQTSLAAEYYNASETSKDKTTTLWNDMAWFPTLNVSYRYSPKHIFQFAVSSDKAYPPYWSLNANTYYISPYSVILGNPHLRPSRDYSIGLTYIHKQKYVIRPYFNYIPDYFVQLPYQSPNRLQQQFMEQNYTYRKNAGIMGVIPFAIGKRISSRVVVNAIYWHEKDDEFFDLSFNRRAIMGIFSMNHDIILSAKPDLKMNVSGYATTPTAIQGIYDLGASGNLSTALTWTFDKQGAKLILKADDIFSTRTPVATVDYEGQKSRLKTFQDTRAITVSFIYRFGGYKDRERKGVDTSRFGTN